MKNILYTLLMAMAFTACQAPQESNMDAAKIKTEIKTALMAQQNCWNAGDVDCFMGHYWNNDSLMFVSGDRVSYGWQKVSDNYKKNYPNKDIMGTLTFDIIKMNPLSSEACVVIGSWNLDRMSGEIGGKFTLLWKKMDGKWVIVSDHTS